MQTADDHQTLIVPFTSDAVKLGDSLGNVVRIHFVFGAARIANHGKIMVRFVEDFVGINPPLIGLGNGDGAFEPCFLIGIHSTANRRRGWIGAWKLSIRICIWNYARRCASIKMDNAGFCAAQNIRP